jgi:hypothetical protein
MLSNARIKELLGGRAERLSDAELNQLTEDLYTLARHVISAYSPNNPDCHVAPEETTLAVIPADEREAVEERAAVLEFDAKMSRDVATRAALNLYVVDHRAARKPHP